MYYHFAFLAISLALFGSGAAACSSTWRATGWTYRAGRRALAIAAALFAGEHRARARGRAGEPALADRPGARPPSGGWPAIYGATALAILLRGRRGHARREARYAHEMSRLYLFDLAGAAAGCLLLIPVLDRLGAVDTVLRWRALAALRRRAVRVGRGGARPAACGAGARGRARRAVRRQSALRLLDVTRAKGLERGRQRDLLEVELVLARHGLGQPGSTSAC